MSDYERGVTRAAVNEIAVARGLTAPWPLTGVLLPEWLKPSPAWGVVELGQMRLRLLDSRQRDRHGIVYTPPEVVAFQVRSALDQANLDRVADEAHPLQHIHIHDPFCGPGIFLLAAAWHVARWYAPSDPAAVLAAVMTECIYGADLDEVAIDLARSVCWLEIDGTRPTTFMDDNIAVGDTFGGFLPPKLTLRWPHPAALVEVSRG